MYFFNGLYFEIVCTKPKQQSFTNNYRNNPKNQPVFSYSIFMWYVMCTLVAFWKLISKWLLKFYGAYLNYSKNLYIFLKINAKFVRFDHFNFFLKIIAKILMKCISENWWLLFLKMQLKTKIIIQNLKKMVKSIDNFFISFKHIGIFWKFKISVVWISSCRHMTYRLQDVGLCLAWHFWEMVMVIQKVEGF